MTTERDDWPVLTPAVLDELAAVATEHGLMRLAAVGLDHEGFGRAGAYLDRYLDEGRHGDMGFLSRTREVRKDPSAMLPGARSVLVVVVPHAGDAGPVARYAQYPDYHTVVYRRLTAVDEALRRRLPGVETTICVDTKPVMERAAAALAGLGFLGKNGCLIVPGLGSYVMLGEILCTARWDPEGAPSVDPASVQWDACGQCTACLDACPTDAFIAPGELDPRRCISYLTIEHRAPIDDALQDAMGERIAGCDVCQEVCPYNASGSRSDRVSEAAWLGSMLERPFDLPHVASLGSARYRALVKDTPLNRIPRRHLRRNALIALGNASGPLSGAERAACERGLVDPQPQIAAAARRAVRRRGG